MKKIFSMLVFAGVVASGSAMAVGDGTITMTGDLTGTSCTITQGASTTGAISFNLGTYSTSKLVKAGDVTAMVADSNGVVKLSNCGTGSQVTIVINTGTAPYDSVNNAFKGGAGTTTTNAEAQVMDATAGSSTYGTVLKAASTTGITVPLTAGAGQFQFGGRFYAVGATTAGHFTSDAIFTILYQ